MSGTIYDEIKKKEFAKKREKLKFFFALISTNLLVAILSFSFKTSTPTEVRQTNLAPILHPQFKMVIIPLIVLADISPNTNETPVTLIDKNKNIIVKRAFLHGEVKNSAHELGSSPRFKIEIPEEQMMKLGTDDTLGMIAIPELQIKEEIVRSSHKRVSKYEVNL